MNDDKVVPFEKELKIGDKVTKYSKKPFKSGLLTNTVKGFTTTEYEGKLKQAVILQEDDTIVNIDMLGLLIKSEELILANDDFVKLGYPILEKLKEYSKPLAVRCEIYGQSLKGSGNKNNPHSNLPKSIAVYGIDDYSLGVCIPLSMSEVIEVCKELNLPMVNITFIEEFHSIEKIKDVCNEYFKTNLIKGIVIRTFETTRYSGKFMNNEYDSLK